MGVIVAHFFFPPSPGQTPRCTADTPTPPFYTTHDQDTGNFLRTPTENRLSLLLHLASAPRDGSAGRGCTETAATGRLCRANPRLFQSHLPHGQASRQKKKTRTLSVRSPPSSSLCQQQARPQPNYGVHTQCLPSDPFYARYSLTSSPGPCVAFDCLGAMPPGSVWRRRVDELPQASPCHFLCLSASASATGSIGSRGGQRSLPQRRPKPFGIQGSALCPTPEPRSHVACSFAAYGLPSVFRRWGGASLGMGNLHLRTVSSVGKWSIERLFQRVFQ
ncbi:hypothetical protein CABS01_12695 [Colletotrichum abscissum]|uniref:uncharacterized protein n=1 Tax=Colletotrichum abscissum TaxID=1671311 RepID=UPI0027D6B1D9|nr:uncharacterized protein CABS01_12695 [Colletotrichum abscissum]KAK1489544.1 hypothetical protein CABS01_12695 [Colletotrichum abscissum]